MRDGDGFRGANKNTLRMRKSGVKLALTPGRKVGSEAITVVSRLYHVRPKNGDKL
jgi:hypothetical protein